MPKRTPAAEPERLSAPALLSLQCRRTELAKYAAGMSSQAYAAACYVWARDEGQRKRLEEALATALLHAIRREGGKSKHTSPCPVCEQQIPLHAYTRWMAEHLLTEVHAPWLYRTPAERAKRLGVGLASYRSRHGPRYGEAWAVLMRWLGEAHAAVKARLWEGES